MGSQVVSEGRFGRYPMESGHRAGIAKPSRMNVFTRPGPEPDTRSGRGYLARSDQGRHLSSLKSASRLAKGLTAAGVGIASTAIIGLYWN
jgi:hypothetical protein